MLQAPSTKSGGCLRAVGQYQARFVVVARQIGRYFGRTGWSLAPAWKDQPLRNKRVPEVARFRSRNHPVAKEYHESLARRTRCAPHPPVSVTVASDIRVLPQWFECN